MLSTREQPVSITPREIEMFQDVDEVVKDAIVMGEPDKMFEHGMHLKRAAMVTRYALAKLLWSMDKNWSLFNIEGEFKDAVFERMGVATETTSKYVLMWENIFENPNIPEAIKKILMGRPIRDTLLLTASAKTMTLEELSNAAIAPDRSSLRELISESRGEQTSSGNALFLYVVTREDDPNYPKGTLLCRRGTGGTLKPYGYLTMDSGDEDIEQACLRTQSYGIQERN